VSAAEPGATPQGRRDLIVEKAAELLARKGISATTVREISDAAGILSGSLYHHFDSKDAIIDAVMSSYLDDLLARYRAVMERTDDVKEMFQGLVVASLRAVEAHPSATIIYQHDAHYFRETARFRYVRVAAEQVRKTWMTAQRAPTPLSRATFLLLSNKNVAQVWSGPRMRSVLAPSGSTTGDEPRSVSDMTSGSRAAR
jgi:AcrR family transcriptional regulator